MNAQEVAVLEDHASLELEVVHDTVYDYAAPVSLAHHLAHLQPLEDDQQQVLEHHLAIDPVPQDRRETRGPFGQRRVHFSLAQLHRRLAVRSVSRLRLQARFEAFDPAASPPWETVRDALVYQARAPLAPAVEFSLPSPFVPRLEDLRDYAKPSFPAGRPVAEGALDLMRRLHADFAYEARSTEVDTPLQQALSQRRGVCQDFAHLMIGALRMLGLPARYVSGYLLTEAAAGQPSLVGADASHAWLQVHAPGTPGVPEDGWLDLDPTNGCVPGNRHIRVAVGRDFGDVTPLRGVIRGGGAHQLTVGVTTRRLSTRPAGPSLQASGRGADEGAPMSPVTGPEGCL